MEMEIVIIMKTTGSLEVRIVKKGAETLDGEIARYPVEEGVNFKVLGGCAYECIDSAPYVAVIE